MRFSVGKEPVPRRHSQRRIRASQVRASALVTLEEKDGARLNGQRPCGLLRQIVPDKVSVLKCESGRVERVLRDRHEHSVLLVAQDELDH
eukprot:6209332-Pleurochrysis_carterae.AAC.3